MKWKKYNISKIWKLSQIFLRRSGIWSKVHRVLQNNTHLRYHLRSLYENEAVIMTNIPVSCHMLTKSLRKEPWRNKKTKTSYKVVLSLFETFFSIWNQKYWITNVNHFKICEEWAVKKRHKLNANQPIRESLSAFDKKGGRRAPTSCFSLKVFLRNFQWDFFFQNKPRAGKF